MMTNRKGEILLAMLVGLAVAGIGMAALTGRHNAIVARDGGLAVDMTRLGKRAAIRENPGKTAAIVAASVAASLVADKIEINIGNQYGGEK